MLALKPFYWSQPQNKTKWINKLRQNINKIEKSYNNIPGDYPNLDNKMQAAELKKMSVIFVFTILRTKIKFFMYSKKRKSTWLWKGDHQNNSMKIRIIKLFYLPKPYKDYKVLLG